MCSFNLKVDQNKRFRPDPPGSFQYCPGPIVGSRVNTRRGGYERRQRKGREEGKTKKGNGGEKENPVSH